MFKLSELFVEITAPINNLNASLKEAQANLEAAAQSMGASASVNLGGAMQGGLQSSLGGIDSTIGASLALALVPLQNQVANLGNIVRRSALQGGGSLQQLNRHFKQLLGAMDSILARGFDRELKRQIDATKNPIWKGWLQGVNVLRRLQNQSEFTRASLARAAHAVKSLNPLGGLFGSRGNSFSLPGVEGVRSSTFGKMLPKNPFAKAPPQGDFGGRMSGGGMSGQYSLLPAVAAAGGMAAGMAKTVNLASTLSETVSKVGVVFGDSASIVTGAADEMAKKFGAPKAEMMDAVSIFGLMAKGAGQSETAAAQFGVSLSKLAMDASSFYNVPLDVALQKIQSGLSGEAEPLRAFGVFLTEDAVKAQAARMGIAALGSELTEGQKIMARSALIFNGLNDAQGDLERTSGGYANQVRELWGRLENLASMLGEALLPTFTDLITKTNDLAKSFESGFGQMKQTATGFVNFFTGVVETLGVIYRNWGTIVERTGVMIGGWWANLGETIAWLGSSIGAFLNWFSTNWRSIFQDAFNATLTALKNLATNFMNFGKSVYDWVTSGFRNPFKFEMIGIMDGYEAKTSALKLPKLNLSNVDDQLAEIDNRMVDTEKHFQEEKAKADQKTEATKKKAEPMAGMPAKEKKGANSEFVGIADFARKIQLGSLDKDRLAKDHLSEARAGNGILREIKEAVKKPQVARAG